MICIPSIKVTFFVAVTYIYFLLFAQFGFLRFLQNADTSGELIKQAMSLMGSGGIVASLSCILILPLWRNPLPLLFFFCALTALISLFCTNTITLCVESLLIGITTGLLTVSVATHIRSYPLNTHPAIPIAWGTGIAYFFCNIPPIFEAPLKAQVMIVSLLCFMASGKALSMKAPPYTEKPLSPISGAFIESALPALAFFLLIFVDSAAFAYIQNTPALKQLTWSSPSQKLLMGTTHLLSSIAAGYFLKKGYFFSLLLLTLSLLALSLPFLQIVAPVYAIGISIYSTALVCFPSMKRDDSLKTRCRKAAIIYGVSGWIGSGLGVVTAQNITIHHHLITKPSITHGRNIYQRESCIHCHSQYIRPKTKDVEWWGPYRPVDFDETPPFIGNRRQGPDLMNVGNRRSSEWQRIHLKYPQKISPGSKMPSYAHLPTNDMGALVAYLDTLGSTTREKRRHQINQWEFTLPPNPSLSNGKKIFDKTCSQCHGLDAMGNGPIAELFILKPRNLIEGPFPYLHSAIANNDPTPLARIIKFGIMYTSMPGHEAFTKQEITDIIYYLESLQK